MKTTLGDRLRMVPAAVFTGLIGAALTLVVSDYIQDAVETDTPTRIVEVFEDGSYRLSDGSSGCVPEALCDEGDRS